MTRCKIALFFTLSVMPTAAAHLEAKEVLVSSSSQLQSEIRRLTPGTTLLLAPGTYAGGIYLENISGTDDAPIVIRGTDPNNPPIFSEGSQAIHLADCSYVTLSNLKAQGFPANGINIDDGGSFETPAHHVTLENLTILETGPTGNHDALKMSGVDHFIVRRCRFEGWGGSAIDMVGCHHGVVEDCNFVGRAGFSQDNAVQLKGGTRHVLVQTCLFKNAGERAINLGGSTDLQFFRPEVGDYEAKDITIAGNRFVGSIAPVAWVTADAGNVHHNTIVLPEKWILRILQETTDPKFKPCHDGAFENNLVVYDSRVQVFVNVGPGVAPQTFTFRHNAWRDLDAARKPSLPVSEIDGCYQVELQQDRTSLTEAKVYLKDERLRTIGADGYTRPK